MDSYVPRIEPSDDPDAWRAEDALFVPLRDPKGMLIGVVSVDEPETGRRPTTRSSTHSWRSRSHAALALRIAQDTANDVQHQRMLEGILEVSARLAEAEDPDEILQAVCDGIRDALGFDKVVIELAARARRSARAVRRRAAGTWSRDAVNHGITLEALAPLFTDEFEVAGCYLVPTEVAEERLGAQPGRLPLGAERPRPARVVAPLAARAAGRAAGPPARADLGGRPARPAAAHPRARSRRCGCSRTRRWPRSSRRTRR